MFCDPPMSEMKAGDDVQSTWRKNDEREQPTEHGEEPDGARPTDELVDLSPARSDDVASNVRMEDQAGHDGQDSPGGVVHTCRVVEVRVVTEHSPVARMHQSDNRQPHHASAHEDQPGPPTLPSTDERDRTERDHVRSGDVGAEQGQDHEDPPAAPVAPKIAAGEQNEESGERLGVVVVRRGPVRPRLEHQHGADTGGDGDGEAPVGRVHLEVFEGPPVCDEAGPGQCGILHDQKVDGVWPHPVKEGERPHDQFQVGLVEGVAVVRIVPGVRGVVGVEVARGNLLPGLAVLAEVRGQVEVVPQVPAVLDQHHELDAEHGEPDEPGNPQAAL